MKQLFLTAYFPVNRIAAKEQKRIQNKQNQLRHLHNKRTIYTYIYITSTSSRSYEINPFIFHLGFISFAKLTGSFSAKSPSTIAVQKQRSFARSHAINRVSSNSVQFAFFFVLCVYAFYFRRRRATYFITQGQSPPPRNITPARWRNVTAAGKPFKFY